MSTNQRIGTAALALILLATVIGCIEKNPNETPDQFDPPPGIYPDQVGKLVLERKWDKNPVCIKNGPVTCVGFYIDPADPDGTRIYYSADIFETPADAIARLEESAREKVMDEDQFVWETLPQKGGRLLVRSGFRSDGESMIGSCSLRYTKETLLVHVASSFSCDAARAFLNDLLANQN